MRAGCGIAFRKLQVIGKMCRCSINAFVANFIGGSNMITAKIVNGGLVIGDTYSAEIPLLRRQKDQPVICSVRPEEFQIRESGVPGLAGVIEDAVYLGLNTHYFVRLDIGNTVEVIRESSMDEILPGGMAVTLQMKEAKVNVFDATGNTNLTKG